jgi:FkbM family methyltransferase
MRLRGQVKQWLYGSCPGLSGAFPYFGTKVYFPKNCWIFHLACEHGIYELQNIQLLRKLVKPNSFYFDIGANIGLMAIPILQDCLSCKVVSWEPSPNTLPFLSRTAENSSFKERWQIIGKAAGAHPGVLDFIVSSPDLGAYDGFQDTQRAGLTKKITVPVSTLDMEWREMGFPSVSVIKVDVEGAELQVLEGAKQCIQQQRPNILLEWSKTNLSAYGYSAETLLSFARGLGYQVFATPHLSPITNPTILGLYMMETESFLLAPELIV